MSSLEYILDAVRKSVESVYPSVIGELIDLIVSSGTVFVYGSGRSGLSGQFFCVRLVQIGIDVHFVGDMTTPIIRRDDLMILISNTGETMSVVQTANIAKRIGSKVVSVTANKESRLAKASDIVIHLPTVNDKEKSINAPLGTLFEESSNVFFDSIVPRIMEKMNVTESDMRGRHAIWV